MSATHHPPHPQGMTKKQKNQLMQHPPPSSSSFSSSSLTSSRESSPHHHPKSKPKSSPSSSSSTPPPPPHPPRAPRVRPPRVLLCSPFMGFPTNWQMTNFEDSIKILTILHEESQRQNYNKKQITEEGENENENQKDNDIQMVSSSLSSSSPSPSPSSSLSLTIGLQSTLRHCRLHHLSLIICSNIPSTMMKFNISMTSAIASASPLSPLSSPVRVIVLNDRVSSLDMGRAVRDLMGPKKENVDWKGKIFSCLAVGIKKENDNLMKNILTIAGKFSFVPATPFVFTHNTMKNINTNHQEKSNKTSIKSASSSSSPSALFPSPLSPITLPYYPIVVRRAENLRKKFQTQAKNAKKKLKRKNKIQSKKCNSINPTSQPMEMDKEGKEKDK